MRVRLALGLAALAAAAAFAGIVPTAPGEYALTNQIEIEFTRASGITQDHVLNAAVGPSTGVAIVDVLLEKYDAAILEPLFPKADPNYEVDLSRFYIITFRKDLADVSAVAREFAADENVEHAAPCAVTEVDFTPSDPWFTNQWALKNGNDYDVDADGAWDINHGSSSYAVAIADTGVDWEHPDLSANIWYNDAEKNGTAGVDDDGNGYVDDDKGWDFVTGCSGVAGEDLNIADNNPTDFNGHGTHCSGIASAATNNAVGVAGVAFDTKIMCLRIGWSGTSGGTEVGYVGMSFAASALRYAADKGAVSFNCSWGSSNSSGLGAAVDYALSKNVLICTAAGNNNNQTAPYLGTRTEVIAVAATDVNGYRSSFSNYGTWVDVSAPGTSIYSTYRYHYGEHTYSALSGTSMACPHVVGEAALVKTKYPSWGYSEIRAKIVSTCDSLDARNPSYAGLLGAGLINCHRAISDTGVTLASFAARPRDGVVAVRWTTSAETNHAGFNLYRREKIGSTYAKLNAELIKGRSPYVFADETGRGGVAYEYLLEDVDLSGHGTQHGPAKCVFPSLMKNAYALTAPYPNPARGNVTISYTLPEGHAGAVSLALYDVAGRRVNVAAATPATPGNHDVNINAASLAPGVYVCRFEAGDYKAATKMVVAR
jgi:subtilisin family serine protease